MQELAKNTVESLAKQVLQFIQFLLGYFGSGWQGHTRSLWLCRIKSGIAFLIVCSCLELLNFTNNKYWTAKLVISLLKLRGTRLLENERRSADSRRNKFYTWQIYPVLLITTGPEQWYLYEWNTMLTMGFI